MKRLLTLLCLLVVIVSNAQVSSLIPVKTTESIFIREMPSLFAKISSTIPKGSNIIVIGFKSEFFIVKFQNQSGFAFYSNIPLNDELNRIKEYYTVKEKKEAALNYAKLQGDMP